MPILIPEQFCGPPGTGNGGFVCGILAEKAGTWPVEVTLRKPVPLDTPLEIGGAREKTLLLNGEVLAEAKPAALVLDIPLAPDPEKARAAEKNFSGFHNHNYAKCFVCGPERKKGDGMRIFAGSLKNRPGVATCWQPEAWQCDEKGVAQPPFVLGALDCPGYFALFDGAPHALLGRMMVDVKGPLEKGETYTVYAWPITVEGRKHFAGSALYNKEGVCVAAAKSIWFFLEK